MLPLASQMLPLAFPLASQRTRQRQNILPLAFPLASQRTASDATPDRWRLRQRQESSIANENNRIEIPALSMNNLTLQTHHGTCLSIKLKEISISY